MTLNFHQKALLIGSGTLALMVGVFLWIVVLDKGTVSVTADTPYDIAVTGDRLKVPEAQSCTSNPCTLQLPSGDFSLTVSKPGYLDAVADFNVLRGETTELAFALSFIPTVTEIDPSEALIATQNALALPSSSLDFEITLDPTYQKQRLDYLNPESGETTTWAYFDRPLVDPLFFPNPDHTSVLVVDQAEGMDSFYWVNGTASTRTWVGETEDFLSLQWFPSNDHLLYQADGSTVLYLLDLNSLELDFFSLTDSLLKTVWIDDETLVFLTDKTLTQSTFTSLDLLNLALEGSEDPTSSSFALASYAPASDTYQTLYEFSDQSELAYDATQLFLVENELYLSDGTTFLQVKLTP